MIRNALFKTLEDGIHTGDLFRPDLTKEKVGTQGFADAVIARLGQQPTTIPAVDYNNIPGCTYTSPEVASVGMSEKAAKEAEQIKQVEPDNRETGEADSNAEVQPAAKTAEQIKREKVAKAIAKAKAKAKQNKSGENAK